MKTMRKWLCLLAAAALPPGCLTGCGEKKEEEARAPLTARPRQRQNRQTFYAHR